MLWDRMPQFTPKTLARLLINVDRETLVEAVALADLWNVFSSFERDALIEMGELQNALANMAKKPILTLESARETFIEDTEIIREKASFAGKMYIDFLNGIFGILDEVDSLKVNIEEGLEFIGEALKNLGAGSGSNFNQKQFGILQEVRRLIFLSIGDIDDHRQRRPTFTFNQIINTMQQARALVEAAMRNLTGQR